MKTLTKVQKDILELNHGGNNQERIAKKLRLSRSYVSGVLRTCEDKGYDVKRYFVKPKVSKRKPKMDTYRKSNDDEYEEVVVDERSAEPYDDTSDDCFEL